MNIFFKLEPLALSLRAHCQWLRDRFRLALCSWKEEISAAGISSMTALCGLVLHVSLCDVCESCDFNTWALEQKAWYCKGAHAWHLPAVLTLSYYVWLLLTNQPLCPTQQFSMLITCLQREGDCTFKKSVHKTAKDLPGNKPWSGSIA